MSEIFGQDKIFSHVDKIHNWLEGDPNTLITMEMDPTDNCNNNCPGCAGGRTGQSSLTLEEMTGYIDQMKDIDVRGLIFSGGGEPLVNPSTHKAISHARMSGLDVGFITNGLALKEDLYDTLLNDCTWIRFSLDAGTPEMYKQTHGMNERAFNKVLENIRGISSRKKEIGSDCTLGVGYLAGKETLGDMVNFARISSELGVDYAQFRPFHRDRTSIAPELAKSKKYERDDFKVLHSAQKYKHFLEENPRPYNECHGVNFASVIQADSNLTTCCHMRGKPKYYLGNLKENTLREIWESDKKKEVFENIDFNDCVPYCRCDSFNRVLYDIKQEKTHKNFL